jgi:hypothetical protein
VSSRGFLLPFLFLFWIVDALTVANARIAALEAELNASREAWEGANAAMLLRRLLSQQKPRLRKLKKHLPILIRSGSNKSKL